jgi:hypothetical protein
MAWWVRIWDRREHPGVLAAVRILLATVILTDLLLAARLELVVGIWGDVDVGGIVDIVGRNKPPEVYRWLPATPGTAWAVWGAAVGSASALLLGIGARVAALVLCLTLAQLALILPGADRGIDMLLRNALLILVFARTDATASLWAHLRTGRFLGVVGGPVPSWPRYLLVVQMVVLYWGAGAAKVSSTWTPFGDYAALYIAMRDPHFARLPVALVDAIYPLTQALTATTWFWEWAAPLLLLAYHYRDTRDRPGWLRATFNRLGFVQLYLLLGFVFHMGTHLTLRLGIFPFAVLSLYPAAFHPDEWARWLAPLRRRLGLGVPRG